jgi:hypothetical protein
LTISVGIVNAEISSCVFGVAGDGQVSNALAMIAWGVRRVQTVSQDHRESI